MPRLKAIHFGPAARMTQIVARHFALQAVVCEADRHNLVQLNVCEWLGIPCLTVADLQGLAKLRLPQADVGVSYGMGMIFPASEISRFPRGIWNIHTGALPEYRGRHPISWAMIHGETEIGVSIHSIDTEIDQGVLLASGRVPRDMDDTQTEIESKILEAVDRSLMKDAIDTALESGGMLLGKGVYHRNLAGGLGEIDPAQVDSRFLFNLLRSQATHGGVQVKGKTYMTGYFYDPAFHNRFEGAEIVTCKDSRQIALFANFVRLDC